MRRLSFQADKGDKLFLNYGNAQDKIKFKFNNIRKMDFEEENRNRIKQYWNKAIEKAYFSNPINLDYVFPKKLSSATSKTSQLSLPSNTSHFYDLHSQNISNKNASFNSENLKRIMESAELKGKGGLTMDMKQRKLKLISVETDRRSTIDEERTANEESCCCLGFFNRKAQKVVKQVGGRKMSVREREVEVSQRTIKRVISCEGKRAPSTKNPSSYSKYSQKYKHSPINFPH